MTRLRSSGASPDPARNRLVLPRHLYSGCTRGPTDLRCLLYPGCPASQCAPRGGCYAGLMDEKGPGGNVVKMPPERAPTVRVERSRCGHRRTVIDASLPKLYCKDCGEALDPYWWIRRYAFKTDREEVARARSRSAVRLVSRLVADGGRLTVTSSRVEARIGQARATSSAVDLVSRLSNACSSVLQKAQELRDRRGLHAVDAPGDPAN